MKSDKGYTLIELVVAVSLLVIVLVGGTAIFYRSFRSSGLSDVQTTVNSSLRSLDEMIERGLRYGTVLRVVNGAVDYDRISCLAAGEGGVTGTSMVVRDMAGGTAIYALSDGKVSSNSSQISNPEIVVTLLSFKWVCRSGVNDKMNLKIEAEEVGKSGVTASSKFEKDINLLNSGIN